MGDRQMKAFDFAADSTKLLITLATGMIALTITFSSDFVGDISGVPLWPILTAWVFYLLSVVFGVATMLSMTGELSAEAPAPEAGQPTPDPTVYAPSVTSKSLIQIALFLLALLFTCIHGCEALTQQRAAPADPPTEVDE
ncbi:hypothetical protein GGR26_000186 [Lewinella marina]|uniref:Uncharacterized protein n=1 Tax=Neolewinella marina TaxID=438751 RepID=A0A2G0CK69_9BACT|nr:hypothetical protein [Neolewinella marina]NJB84441.1 hypothetical protein [Neolewinella marina]PHL00366.1 hypothetical protein CGL56_04850 [Neolewinella marina]